MTYILVLKIPRNISNTLRNVNYILRIISVRVWGVGRGWGVVGVCEYACVWSFNINTDLT